MTARMFLLLVGAFVFVVLTLTIALEAGGTDCAANGSPGSAQADRDLQHCLRGR